MWGGIVDGVIAPEQRAIFAAQFGEFCALRAQQPGHLGDLDIDVGAGRSAHLVLWESLTAHDAVQPILRPAFARLVRPLVVDPNFLGAGDVVRDMIPWDDPTPETVGYADILRTRYVLDRITALRVSADEFWSHCDQLPGFRGGVVFSLGEGQFMSTLLWRSEQEAQAAQADINASGDRLLGSLWAAPPTWLASGQVVRNTLVRP